MLLLLLACGGDPIDSGETTTAPSDTSTETATGIDTSTGTDTVTDTDTTPTETDTDTGDPAEMICEELPRQVITPTPDAESGGAIFRFRTYLGSAPSWVSEPASHSLMGSDVVTTYRGPEIDGISPFRDRVVTQFGGEDHWRADDTIDANDLSIEVWFRTSTSTGWQTLFSNTEGGGFSLKVKEGQLRGLFRVKDGSSYESLEHIAFDVADGQWHHAVFTVDNRSDGGTLCLWLDGESDCTTYTGGRTPKDSNVGPTVGAEPNEDGGSYTYTDFFDGEIYGVVIHDYVMNSAWLSDRVLRDGSRYFDTPSYHDYLSGSDGVEQRMADAIEPHEELLAATAARYRLPFQDDRYIVQGVSGTPAGEVLMSLYYGAKDLHSTCSEEPYSVPGIIVSLDPCTSSLSDVWMLRGPNGEPNDSHLGGLAMIGRGGLAWTTYPGSELALYDLTAGVEIAVDDLTEENLLPSGAPKWLDAVMTVPQDPDCGASYLSWERDADRLWIGKFDTSSGAPVCLFELEADGSIGDRLGRWTLPVDNVQGVQPLGDGRVLLTTSYGNSDSEIFLWTPGESEATRLVKGPAGFEDMWLSPEGLIWTASESGARYFQKRFDENALCGPGWGDLYPYLFALDLEVLGL